MRVFHSTPSSQIKHQKVQQEHHQPHHKHQHPLTEEEREQNEEKFGSNPKCWSCSNFLNRISLFCHSCEKVQPPSQYDYFELMGVPKQFDLDTKKLEKHFWALQRKLHPDNFHTASEREKAFSQGISSMINQAYSTLKHPQKRAKYLLKLAGIEVDETTETITDPGLLMGVMEIRMQVEEAGDEQLRALDAENKKRLADLYHRISKAFAENRFEEAKQIAFKLQYYGRIDEEIHKKKKIV
jgi:molecular chaperone HscB